MVLTNANAGKAISESLLSGCSFKMFILKGNTAAPYVPGGGGFEADIMEALALLERDSIEQDYLLEMNTSIPSMPCSSFTIPFHLTQGEEDNDCAALLEDHTAYAAVASSPYPSRANRTESFSSRTGKENGQSTKKKLFVDIDSHYMDSEYEFADLYRLLSPGSNTSSKTHRSTTHVQIPKRDRATHVHNLSEKRRRNRINDKLKALQLLIPNCEKTDKASILQEAIEYVKQLQHQVQILSSPNKMNPSHISVPMGIPCFQMPQMCINTNIGFNGMGTNMAHSHLQWNNGFMTVPQGVQGQTIPPWANEQYKD